MIKKNRSETSCAVLHNGVLLFLPLLTENQPQGVRAVVKNVEKLNFIPETLVFCFNIRENNRQELAYAGEIVER